MPEHLKSTARRNGLRLGAAAFAIAALAAIGCGEGRATTSPGTDQFASASGRTLVECPTATTTSTQALIGLLGGTVSLGGHVVDIPAGALPAPTLITITVPASRYMEIDVKANDLTSFLFRKPVSITIDYSRCARTDVDTVPLTVWHIDTQTKALLENMGGEDDKARRRIRFSTEHLSGYAIAN